MTLYTHGGALLVKLISDNEIEYAGKHKFLRSTQDRHLTAGFVAYDSASDELPRHVLLFRQSSDGSRASVTVLGPDEDDFIVPKYIITGLQRYQWVD